MSFLANLYKKWHQEHRDYFRERDKKNRMTPKGKLNNCMGTAIYLALKGNKNGRGWEKIVGYANNELKLHLEKQFIGKNAWMNWNNYGAKRGWWTIDHIKAKSLFHYETAEDPEFLECWALDNLQPMEYLKNIRKSSETLV